MFERLVSQMKKQLVQLDTWLTAAEAHAKAKSFDPAVLLDTRLAPDQFPFEKQVRFACDTAIGATTRLLGQQPASSPDAITTFEALHARVQAAIAHLDGLAPHAFDAAADAVITQPRWEGRTMTGLDYFVEHALPNFYFHLTHAYALLRHNGVTVGKRDYLGPLTQKAPSA
jgi:uncharacterized protein